jgi:hypothetical protein
MITSPFTIASGSFHPNCPICGNRMFSITEYSKAKCQFQYGINETFLCLECEVKDELKESIGEILRHPSGPSCRNCQRYGLDGCLMACDFGGYSDDSCYTTGERNLAVRLDCSILGDAHPCHA